MGSELVDIKIKTNKGLFQLLVLHHELQSCLSILPILVLDIKINDNDETHRLHTPGTSTETGAPEVAAASDVDDGQMTEIRRECRERGSIDVQG